MTMSNATLDSTINEARMTYGRPQPRSSVKLAHILDHGRALHYQRTGETNPEGRDIVWALFVEAADTLHRMPAGQSTSGGGISWPFTDVLDGIESFAGDVSRLALEGRTRLDDRSHALDIALSRSPALAEAIDRYWTVCSFRGLLEGRNRGRDWKILWLLAMKQAVPAHSPPRRSIAAALSVTEAVLKERKRTQCGTIYAALHGLTGAD